MLLRLATRYLRPYRVWLSIVLLLQLVSVIANLYLPSLNAAIVDNGISRGNTGYVWSEGGRMLVVSLIQIVASVGATYGAARTALGFGRDLRAGIFHTVGGFSAREISTFTPATLITRNTNDVLQVQMLVVLTLTLMVSAPIMAVGGIIMALREDVGLSWLLLVAIPVLAIVLGIVISRMVPGMRRVQTRVDVVNRVLREQLSGVRVIRAFAREPFESNRFDDANADLTDAGIRVTRLMAIMFPVVMVVMNVTTVAVWWFGAHAIDQGDIQIGALTAYMSYLIQILMAVMMATFMFMLVPRAAVAADRISEVLETTPSVAPPTTPVGPDSITGAVRLDNVSLLYPGASKPVLDNVSLRAEPGEMVAIIGATGAGKTTLVRLIARLLDATSGTVALDGYDIRDLDPAAYQGHIGLVPQRAFLFTGTVASNLRYGNPDATDDALWHAVDIAQATDFVTELGGLDAPIAQGGTNVSGGQRQRLCIARALVAKPEIYLFDDSFSALDVATDARLRAALRPEIAHATAIVVAQRVSTIRTADRIVVIEDGAVVGMGTHDELMANCATYREIAASQNREYAQ